MAEMESPVADVGEHVEEGTLFVGWQPGWGMYPDDFTNIEMLGGTSHSKVGPERNATEVGEKVLR